MLEYTVGEEELLNLLLEVAEAQEHRRHHYRRRRHQHRNVILPRVGSQHGELVSDAVSEIENIAGDEDSAPEKFRIRCEFRPSRPASAAR